MATFSSKFESRTRTGKTILCLSKNILISARSPYYSGVTLRNTANGLEFAVASVEHHRFGTLHKVLGIVPLEVADDFVHRVIQQIGVIALEVSVPLGYLLDENHSNSILTMVTYCEKNSIWLAYSSRSSSPTIYASSMKWTWAS